jgi:tyrosine-protein kinase Etk/Wzc
LNSLKAEVEAIYQTERSRLEELHAKKETLEKEIEELNKRLGAIPEKEIELSKIENRIALLEDKYELLLKKQSEAEISRASTPRWEVTVISPAGPAVAQRTRDYIRMALGPFFSLIVAIALAFFFESLDHSVKNMAEVEQYLGLPVLAVLREWEE